MDRPEPRARERSRERVGQRDDDGRQLAEVMAALAAFREAERAVARAAQRHMDLGASDMKALRFIMEAADRGETATPSAIARHLGISTASTTKLLDRLERAGRVRRVAHPSDRRALAIEVDPETRADAIATMGRPQALREAAVLRLAPEERDVVARFLRGLAADLRQGLADWSAGP